MNSNNKATVPKVNDSPRGTTFYYLATCLLLLLMVDKQYSNPAKGYLCFCVNGSEYVNFLLSKYFLESSNV